MGETERNSAGVFGMELARALRQIGTLLQGRVSILRAVSVAARDTHNPELASALMSIRSAVENGMPLSRAFEEHSPMPPVALELLAAAEEQGALDTQLFLVADYLAKDSETYAKITSEQKGAFAPVLQGQLVALGALDLELIPTYFQWWNSAEAMHTGLITSPATLEQCASELRRMAESRDIHLFTVYELSTRRPIGAAWLFAVDQRNRRCELGVLIGERECRCKGYGTEAARLALDYAFNILGLNSVMMTVPEFNLAGLRLGHKAGFREFGRRRRCVQNQGTLWDLVYMECLADEFESPVLNNNA